MVVHNTSTTRIPLLLCGPKYVSLPERGLTDEAKAELLLEALEGHFRSR